MVAAEHRLLQVCAHTLTCLPWQHCCASLRTSPFALSPSLASLPSLLVVPLLLASALYGSGEGTDPEVRSPDVNCSPTPPP